jgi:hypothetical protein
MSAKEVRALIQERLGVGQLPSGPADKIYGGRGSNTAGECRCASEECHLQRLHSAFAVHPRERWQ